MTLSSTFQRNFNSVWEGGKYYFFIINYISNSDVPPDEKCKTHASTFSVQIFFSPVSPCLSKPEFKMLRWGIRAIVGKTNKTKTLTGGVNILRGEQKKTQNFQD